ncbi:MAG TPA: EAL domain-containing protein [Clostridia bacterium]|nr:EAL domain-containing protein [Clostridia bacterium]
MQHKNKLVLAAGVVTALLFAAGALLLINLHSIAVKAVQTSLSDFSEQAVQAVRTEIQGNLNVLKALSGLDAFSDPDDFSNRKRILNQEASQNTFRLVVYSDPSGKAVTNHKLTLQLGNRAYFQKALAGQATISYDFIDADNSRKEIIYCVPVIRANRVCGVLAAAAQDSSRFSGLESLNAERDITVWVLRKDGTVIDGKQDRAGSGDFFSASGVSADASLTNRLKSDFLNGVSGTSVLRLNGSVRQTIYMPIPGSNGWILWAEKNDSGLFENDQSLLFTAVLFLLLLFVLAIVLFYFFRFQRISHEASIRSDEQKRYFVYADSLTNLPNRKGMKRLFTPWSADCKKCSQNGGAFFLDVDNFRSVNNTFGHDSGDKFLCETATRLRRILGSGAQIGRIGGDEFMVLVSGLAAVDDLELYAGKILTVFKEPYLLNGIVIQLSCSIGAILYKARDEDCGSEFDDILNRGEFLMQEAKAANKGSYILFNDAFGDRIDHQLQLEAALKSSIASSELLCYFQPQYNCQEKTLVGFETLARWKSARFGMVSPSEFIPMAEKSGFINDLGRFMIEKTFAFAKSVEGRGLTISFNASPVELLQANFTDYIIGRFDYYDLAPNSVALEITESCLIESFDEVIRKLEELRAHGIPIYLDDFGTGFSSLTYLKNLPINAVKIDKSFIDEIVTNNVEKDIVGMIIRLAHRLDLLVIAEGVETQEQVDCVAECGCNIVQGYIISRPVPQNEVLSLLDLLDKPFGAEADFVQKQTVQKLPGNL